MALKLADRVRETTTTAGTGTLTLSGAAPTGYQTFQQGVGDTNTTYYTINANNDWEVGIGTYSVTGPTLTRDTVLASSANGAKVDFPAGTKDVFVTYPAEKSIADGYGLLPVANGGTGTNTQFTAGSVVFAGASGVYSQDNANLFWDDTNNRLGIGTSSPDANLTIAGGGGTTASDNISITGRNAFNHAYMLTGASTASVDFLLGTQTAIPLAFYTWGACLFQVNLYLARTLIAHAYTQA